MAGHGQKIEQRQERAISALLLAPTIRDAAKKAGISESTLIRWLKDGAFLEEYRKAKRRVVQQAISQLQSSVGKAVKVLVEIAEDKDSPSSSRVSAARAIVETALKAVELEDIEKRIIALEIRWGGK